MALPFIRRRPRAYGVPDGERVYAVGDIHGRLDLLDELLGKIVRDDAARSPARTHLIFLGDFVDRGPDSRGVVARVLTLLTERPDTYALMGNHEEILLTAAEGDTDVLRLMLRVGGKETLDSYGFAGAEIEEADAVTLSAGMARRIPAAHLAGLAKLDRMVRIGDVVFVHAGIRPRIPLDEQEDRDLRWIREPFLSYRGDHGVLVVHGHTIVERVDELPNRINIDTGAYASGTLTALGLEGGRRWYLATGSGASHD